MTPTLFSWIVDVVAQYFAIFYSPIFVFWLVIHSNIRHWRQLGNKTYWFGGLLWSAICIPLLIYRSAIFASRLPTPWWTTGLGLLLLGYAVRMGWLATRVIPRRTVVGLAEVAPQKNDPPMLNTGIYSRTRNPIIFAHLTAAAALALLSGFAAIWLLLALDLLLAPWMIRTEERELIARFGSSYSDYMQRVPRFIPKRP